MANKSITSRIKITGTGKLLRRKMGQGHFRAKKSPRQIARKGGMLIVHPADRKVFIKKYGLSA